MCGSTWEFHAVPVQRMSFREIADDITSRIRSGEYPPGAELPSAAELGRLYSVSKATGERALALLSDRGLTIGVRGRGTYVATGAGRE
jgi:GntR family transcriptional regulator